MTRSVRAACFAVACACAFPLALLAIPIGCDGQEVIIARAGPKSDAGEGESHPDGSEASAPCSGDNGVPPPWWCATDAEANASCRDDGGGPFCVGGNDARARPPGEGGAGQPCSNNDDCPSPNSSFCAKSSCEALEGQCQQRPATCDDAPAGIFCGCDGVNYWNDCLRRADGVASSTEGECTFAFAACDGGAPPHTTCPVPDAFCFIQAMGECNGGTGMGVTGGVCWVLPFQCPADAGVRDWQSCGDPPGECVDLCSAIQSSKPHARAGMGCQ